MRPQSVAGSRQAFALGIFLDQFKTSSSGSDRRDRLGFLQEAVDAWPSLLL
jgi:hypothetical protein